MTYTTTVKVYKSGNSKVITIPAKVNIKEGDKLKLRATNGNISLKAIGDKPNKTESKVDKYAGMWKGEIGDEIEKHAKKFRKNFKLTR